MPNVNSNSKDGSEGPTDRALYLLCDVVTLIVVTFVALLSLGFYLPAALFRLTYRLAEFHSQPKVGRP